MFYPIFISGETSVDIAPPDQPIDLAPLEEFESAGGGILVVEPPVGNTSTTTGSNVFDVGLYLGSVSDDVNSAGEIRWASDNLIHSLYSSFSGIFSVSSPSIDETFQSFDPTTRTLSIDIDFTSADLSDEDQFLRATNDPLVTEILSGFLDVEFSSDFRSVTGFAVFNGIDFSGQAISGWLGGFAGRLFDGLEYIATYSDLIGAFGANSEAGLSHYVQAGRAEGRFPFFDGLQYIASHPDLILAFGADRELGTRHYIDAGFTEGRLRDDFDAEQYLANHPDLQVAFGDDEAAATLHFITIGFFEQRTDDFII
jgi:hypothetical protein